jgi:hypothetical protein
MNEAFIMVYRDPYGNHYLGLTHSSRESVMWHSHVAETNGYRPIYLLHVKGKL